ncbi:MAG: hydrogenase, partial [Anaerolineae bacterium]
MNERDNPMRPILGTLAGVKDLADDIKLFQIELNGKGFHYDPGQFAFVSAFGVGEAPFGLASTVERTSVLEFAISRVGTVTSALHKLEPG